MHGYVLATFRALLPVMTMMRGILIISTVEARQVGEAITSLILCLAHQTPLHNHGYTVSDDGAPAGPLHALGVAGIVGDHIANRDHLKTGRAYCQLTDRTRYGPVNLAGSVYHVRSCTDCGVFPCHA